MADSSMCIMPVKEYSVVEFQGSIDLAGKDSEENKDEALLAMARVRNERSTTLALSQLPNLSTIPEELGNCSRLVRLRIDNNFNLTSLPSSLADLTSLEHLDLSYNALPDFPPEIRHLKFLRTLNLSNNRVRTVIREIDALKQLETLFLDNNCISALPPAIMALRRLKEFSISNNPLVLEQPDVNQAKKKAAELQGDVKFVVQDPNDPLKEEDCTMCQGDLAKGALIVFNFLDITDVKNVPIRYTVCGLPCKGLVEELQDTEVINYSTLVYD